MRYCPYPIIPAYLGTHAFPEDGIRDARVTHIWTQDSAASRDIAASSNIETVVEKLEDMVDHIDGLLLARDDYDNHESRCMPFLAAGLPVYVDKPLATTIGVAERIYRHQLYDGQVFSCSALSFAPEFTLSEDQRLALGQLRTARVELAGTWERYSIHGIEPLLVSAGDQGEVVHFFREKKHGKTSLSVLWESGFEATVTTTEGADISPQILFFGSHGHVKLVFHDRFNAFKNALTAFVRICRNPERNATRDLTMRAIQIIENGL